MKDDESKVKTSESKVTSDVIKKAQELSTKINVSLPTVNTVNTVRLDPVNEKPKVSLQVFLNVSGLKPESYAGFLWWAKSRRLRTETIEGWQKLYDQHQSRPVR